ncbi:unnamed protein product [Closterium sp. NIES-53]
MDWIRVARLQLRERFGSDFPVLRLHSDRGGEFSSDLLRAFCRVEGIRQTFSLPASPQQNGIAERRIGTVMDINLQPHVSLPETSPTLRWTGKVGDASAFRVWGSRAFVRDLSADMLSSRAVPCVFLGSPPDAPGWQFYHPTSRRVLSSQDVTFDESVLYYHAVEPVEVAADSGASGGAEPECAESGGAEPERAESGGAEPERAEPGGAASGGAGPGAAGSGGVEPAGAGRGGPLGVLSQRELPSPQELRQWFARRWSRAAGADAGGTGVVSAGSGGAARPQPYFVPLLEQVLGLPPSPSPAPSSECPPPVQSESQLQLVSPLPAPPPYAGPTGGLAERREPESRPVSPVCTARTSRGVPRQRPPAVPGTHQMALRPSTTPLRVPLPSPPESSLPTLANSESDSLRAASPTVMRVLTTVVTDASFESTAASALVAELVDFAAHCRLDYAASLFAESASVCPPSVGGECALGMDVLEDRQEEFQCFAAALPHLVSTLLAPEGDPDAPDIPTQRSYAEAIEGPYSSQWQAAMDAEMASWKSTDTYIDEVPPPGANIVSGMWIFRVKRPPGSPPVFKARYVARGFSQRQGVDYFQTFSPTPKMTTLRVLLHVAAQRDSELHSLDFSTAFLQGSLHEEIWLRRPPGFTGSFPPGTQWSLHRPVYGLRQAPREWHDTLRTTLAALGFAPSTADPSLFLRTDTSLPPFYILVYVEDLVFATADTARLAHVKSELQKRHTCTDLVELRSYLGLQITRVRAQRTITLTQSHMVQQVLQRFDFTYSSPQATPLSSRHSLSALHSDESVEPSGMYPELVGCLMYLMTCTRPDLAYPLSILARYVAPRRHRPEHMAAAKRVLRYLCSTSGLGLVLGGRSPVVLTGHADASWADDQATQRSSQGYTFSLGSGSFSWQSTRSSSVLGSSCEAEIYAGAMAAQELRWLTYLLTDLGEPPRSPPVLYVGNKAMLALFQEHRLEHRTKLIALRYFLARELQQRGQLRLAYVASEANTADIFTKALPPACFALLDWSCDLLFSPTAYGGCSGVAHQKYNPIRGPPQSTAPLVASPWPTCRVALLAVASPSPARRVALPVVASPCPFDTWLDDLQLYLLSDSRYSVSLFGHTSGASLAPPAIADSATRSQWLTRDAAARLAVRNHLSLAEHAHFGQHKNFKALYDAVVACYSSPATTALGRLILPYLFLELSAFATVEDLVTHLRNSDARYRSALLVKFLDTPPPPPRDVLLVALRASPSLRGVPPLPLPHPTILLLPLTSLVLRMSVLLLLLVGSAASARARVARVVAVAAGVVMVVEAVEAVEVAEVVAAVGVVAGVGALLAAEVAAVGVGVAVVAAMGVVAAAVVAARVELSRGEVLPVARGNSSSVGARPLRLSSFVSGVLSVGRLGKLHTQHHYFSLLDDAWRAEFGDEAERPCWLELLRSRVYIFALDYDAILAAMYALSVRAEGDCYLCVSPDLGIEAADRGGEFLSKEFLIEGIRTDRGGEFLSKEFSLWLKKNGIRHSLTMPYSPAMNGIAERANRTITETARGLLIEAGLPDYFWPDAVRNACVAKNRALTHVGADKWVPYVEWIGRKPKVDMLRVFGCMCMALVPKHLRHNKLGAKVIWAVHLGMAQNSKGWLLWDPFTKKFLVSRDCKFMENLMYKDWMAENEAKIGMRFGEVKSSGLEHVELPLELSSSSTTTRQSSLVNASRG